jgi:hypothetical protein
MRAAIALVALVACSEPPPRGQLMLAIDTDMAAGTDFDRFQIEIRQEGQETFRRTYREFGQPGLEVHFPATFAVTGNDRPETRILLRVVTGKVGPTPGNPEVGQPMHLREIVTTVPRDRIALVRVKLEWLCRKGSKLESDGYVEGICREGETCIAGECVDWTAAEAELPKYAEADVFGGGGPRGDGACFDTIGCFATARAVTPDSACTIEQAPGDRVNVALVPKTGEGGICAGDVCLVPLDHGGPHGWRAQDGRIALPKKACEAGLRAVAVSDLCATKTVSRPTCGPWSTVTTLPGSQAPPQIAGL